MAKQNISSFKEHSEKRNKKTLTMKIIAEMEVKWKRGRIAMRDAPGNIKKRTWKSPKVKYKN